MRSNWWTLLLDGMRDQNGEVKASGVVILILGCDLVYISNRKSHSDHDRFRSRPSSPVTG